MFSIASTVSISAQHVTRAPTAPEYSRSDVPNREWAINGPHPRDPSGGYARYATQRCASSADRMSG
jgi:hypothetical protein